MFIIILACAMTLSMMIATMVMVHNETVHIKAEERRRATNPFAVRRGLSRY